MSDVHQGHEIRRSQLVNLLQHRAHVTEPAEAVQISVGGGWENTEDLVADDQSDLAAMVAHQSLSFALISRFFALQIVRWIIRAWHGVRLKMQLRLAYRSAPVCGDRASWIINAGGCACEWIGNFIGRHR